MTQLQERQGFANGTLTNCDVCGATVKSGEDCPHCAEATEQPQRYEEAKAIEGGWILADTGDRTEIQRHDADLVFEDDAAALSYVEALAAGGDTHAAFCLSQCGPIQPHAIDLTPESCKTPEGAAKVAAALEAWTHSQADLANAASAFLDAYETEMGDFESGENGEDARQDYKELVKAADTMATAQDTFLRTLAGR